MTIEPQTFGSENPFASSDQAHARLRGLMQASEVLAMTHSKVESLVLQEGTEYMRRLYEDHMRLRTVLEEPQPSVQGADGVERRHRRRLFRQVESIFGPVEFGRLSYGARGSSSLRPLDKQLNLPPDHFSFGVRRQNALDVAKGPFGEAVNRFFEKPGARVARRQSEELAIKAAVDFEDFYAARAEVAGTLALAGRGSILVLSADAKGLAMRHEDLRDETRRAAEKEPRDRSVKLKPGQKKNRKRMATAVAVYTINQFPRRPDDIVDELRRRKKAEKRPKPYKKRVWASIEYDAEPVIRQAFEEAAIRDPGRKKTWVALVDGNATQIEIFQRLAKEYGVEITIVLDIIHTLGYLWGAAHAFFKAGAREAEDWVTERLQAVLEGRADYVARGIRQSATKTAMSKEKRKAIDKCARYFQNHKDLMRYDEYLAAGFPIATGVIEGVCRHLIKDRMDVTGARWSLKCAEAVLRLRALWASDDFDEYWEFHERQEAERNHAALFALPVPPPEAKPTADPVIVGLAG